MRRRRECSLNCLLLEGLVICVSTGYFLLCVYTCVGLLQCVLRLPSMMHLKNLLGNVCVEALCRMCALINSVLFMFKNSIERKVYFYCVTC